VSKVRPREAPQHAPLPVSRLAPGGVEEPSTSKKVALAGAGRLGNVRPAAEAWSQLAAPLRARRGIRLVVYGITGKGKTTGVIDFLRYIEREKLVDLVIVHDVKFRERKQYDGAVVHEATDVYTQEHAPAEYPATVVLRKRGLDHMPSVDRAARVVLESADAGVTSMLVVDEFARATDEEIFLDGKQVQFRKGSTNRIACEGLGLGASLIALKQLPQYTPTEVRSQSELLLFGMAGDGLTHLIDEKAIPLSVAQRLPLLPTGHFLIKPAEGEPDLTVYKVPPP
jgi:hypothetical protein